MATKSLRVFRRLEGLFCVYKPPGVHWKHVRDTIETIILKGVNAASPPVPIMQVKFLAEPGKGNDSSIVLSATSVPALINSHLVSGPEFQHIKVGVGHRLDVSSSGVQVIGVGNGNKALSDLYRSRITRDYTLEGEFGIATDDFSQTGRIIERSTYGHITRDKLERVLAMIHGANQKALLMYSNIDMRSKEAYKMAVEGTLGPDGKSAPILTALRCIHFQPPHFTLEVQCMNETQKYLRKVLHEVGLELRSNAVCRGVRRTREGPFTLQDALTRHHWTVPDVTLAIQRYHASKKDKNTCNTQVSSQRQRAQHI